jgi:hypothetical protein
MSRINYRVTKPISDPEERIEKEMQAYRSNFFTTVAEVETAFNLPFPIVSMAGKAIKRHKKNTK